MRRADVDGVYFTQDGVFVQPCGASGFWWTGPAWEFLSVLVASQIDVAGVRFRVREVL